MNKICTKCKKEKNIDDFYKNQLWCKSCLKEYRKNNKDKINKYKEINKKKIQEQNKKYYKNHKTEIIEKSKKYYKDNIEKKKEYIKNNKEKIYIYNKNYRNENKCELAIKSKQYIEKNIELMLMSYAKRRSRERNIFLNIKLQDIIEVMPKDKICPLLEISMFVGTKKEKDNSFTLDRIDSNKGYIKDNIQIISHKANRSKGDATIEEYKKIVNNLRNLKIDFNEKQINVNAFIKRAKRRAKIHNISFNLDKEYLKLIYPKNNKCPLLDIEFDSNKNHTPFSASLDRIIPQKGYIKGNVVFVSNRANMIKNNLSLEEMKLLVKNWQKILEERNVKKTYE